MPTIESLVIAIGADPTGLKRGLLESSDALRSFGRVAETELAGLSKAPQTALVGYQAAQDLLNGLKAKLADSSSQVREFLFKGIITREEFTEKGRLNAAAFNSALLSGLTELRGRGILIPEMEQLLVRELRDDGLKAGDAFVKAAQAQMARIAAPSTSPLKKFAESTGQLGKLVDDTNGRFTSLGQRGATALRSVEFGLEQIVSGAGSAEGAARGALRGVGTFAEAFGPAGIVVSALSAGGLALYSFWNEQREQAEKTKSAFKSSLADLFNAGNVQPLEQRLQELQRGRPSINAGIDVPEPGSLIVKGGLDGLKAQLRTFEQQYDEAIRTHNVFLFNSSKAGIRDLQAQIAPIQSAYDDVRRAIFQLPSSVGTGGTLAPVTITASNTKTELRDISAEVSNLTGLLRLSTDQGGDLSGIYDRMAATARVIEGQLAKQTDQYGAQALKLREQLETLEKTDAVRLRLGLPVRSLFDVSERPGALLPGVMPSVAPLAPAVTESVNRYVLALGKAGPALDGIRRSASAVRDVADAFGEGGQQVGAMTDEVTRLVDSIFTLQSGSTSTFAGLVTGLSGLAGIAGAAISIGSGFFQQSPADARSEALLAENSRSLERLRESLDKSASTGTNLSNVQKAVASYLSGDNAAFRDRLEKQSAAGRPGSKDIHADVELNAFLTKFHLTTDQILVLAKQYGVTIFDNGRLVTNALQILAQDIAASTPSLTRFGTDFSAVDSQFSLRDKLFGKNSQTDALNREIEELTKFAPTLGAAFAGIDTTTTEGRAKIRTALQALYQEIAAGALSLSDLGDFGSIDELLQVIGGTSDALDALGDAADSVSGALRNVPQGFKVAAETFAATDALVRQLLTTAPGAGGNLRAPTSPDTAIPVASAAFTFAPGSIVIQGTDKSAAQLLDEIAVESQRRATAIGVDPAEMLAYAGRGAVVTR